MTIERAICMLSSTTKSMYITRAFVWDPMTGHALGLRFYQIDQLAIICCHVFSCAQLVFTKDINHFKMVHLGSYGFNRLPKDCNGFAKLFSLDTLLKPYMMA